MANLEFTKFTEVTTNMTRDDVDVDDDAVEVMWNAARAAGNDTKEVARRRCMADSDSDRRH